MRRSIGRLASSHPSRSPSRTRGGEVGKRLCIRTIARPLVRPHSYSTIPSLTPLEIRRSSPDIPEGSTACTRIGNTSGRRTMPRLEEHDEFRQVAQLGQSPPPPRRDRTNPDTIHRGYRAYRTGREDSPSSCQPGERVRHRIHPHCRSTMHILQVERCHRRTRIEYSFQLCTRIPILLPWVNGSACPPDCSMFHNTPRHHSNSHRKPRRLRRSWRLPCQARGASS
jgi:hypothetical protein